MLAQLKAPESTTATNSLLPNTALPNLPVPAIAPPTSLPIDGLGDGLSLARLATELPPTADGKLLPLSGNGLPQPEPALAPQPQQAAKPDQPEAAVDLAAALEVNPTTAPVPIDPALPAAGVNASSTNVTSNAPSLPQVNLTASNTPNSTATPVNTPAVATEAGTSSGDQSAEYTFTERQQAELATKLSRADNETLRQEVVRSDATRTAATEFARVEPSAHTSPLNMARPAMEAPAPQSGLLNLPADRAQWSEPLAERIAWMLQKGGNTAELRLNPPHLGRIEVQFTLNGDQASIVMTTASAEVRDALQQSLPRLENLLQQSGLQLTDSQVAQQEGQTPEDQGFDTPAGDNAENNGEPHPGSTPIALGLIDTYA